MARSGINSAEARRIVRIAQFAGLGLGVLAAALWAMEVPGLGSALPAKPAVTAASPEETPTINLAVAQISDRDASVGIAERLDVGANRPPAPAVTTEAPPVTPLPQTTRWKYLGAIKEAARTLALVSLEGSQKIVSEGSTVSIRVPAAEGRPESVDYRATVSVITPEFIEIVEEGGARRHIDLEARTARVAWVKNMPSTVAGASGMAANAAMTAEQRQRLLAQGIDPSQAERARLAAMAGGRNVARPENNAAVTALTGARSVNVKGAPLTKSKDGLGVVPMSDADADAAGDLQDDAKRKKRDSAAEINP